LYNEDQKGGFRDDRKCNRDLLLGPDFGGIDPGKATYLPAWQRYALAGDRSSPIRYGFESRIGSKPDATREGELEEARTFVLETYPRLEEVPEAVERLALAEHSWEKARNLEAFDFGALIVSFAKAVECYLAQVRIRDERPEVASLLRQLKNLRVGGAHATGPRTREHVVLARNLALTIFKQGEEIRQTC
jgi:hypothetical protein